MFVRELPQQFIRQELPPLSQFESNLELHIARLLALHPQFQDQYPPEWQAADVILKMQMLREINEALGIRDLRNVIDV